MGNDYHHVSGYELLPALGVLGGAQAQAASTASLG